MKGNDLDIPWTSNEQMTRFMKDPTKTAALTAYCGSRCFIKHKAASNFTNTLFSPEFRMHIWPYRYSRKQVDLCWF